MFSSDWPYTKRVISALRARLPSALIVAGGEHVTATPHRTLEQAPELDCAVMGEGEETACALVRGFADGRDLSEVEGLAYRGSGGQLRLSRRNRIREIDEIARPAWHLVPVQNYIDHQINFGLNRGISMPVLASRGCPFECTFCSNPAMWTTLWSSRSPELLLDEIEHYMSEYGATNFDFYDLTAIVNKKWILEFTAAIRRRGLVFSWQLPSGTRSEAIDAEVAPALMAAGCVYLAYSPESGSPRILREVKKKVKLDNMMSSMRASVAAGMIVKANMIMGLPGETLADMVASMKFIARMAVAGVSDMSISPFAPYPGSELFESLDREAGGKLSTDDFYLQLSAQTDLTQNYSWNDRMSPGQIAKYRVIGHALFYGLAVLRRPWRVVLTLRNLASGYEATVLDKSVRGFFHRQFGRLTSKRKVDVAA